MEFHCIKFFKSVQVGSGFTDQVFASKLLASGVETEIDENHCTFRWKHNPTDRMVTKVPRANCVVTWIEKKSADVKADAKK